MMNKRFGWLAAFALVLSVSAVVFAQAIPPRPQNNTNAIATLWPMVHRMSAALTGTPGATVVATNTPTVATNTPTVATNTPAPTATTAAPTATATPHAHAGAFDCSIPLAQRNYLCGSELVPAPLDIPNLADELCPAWVHDKYIAAAAQDATGEWRTREVAPLNVGATEVVWRTWHPNRDAQTGCVFAHEHGFDWRGHRAITGPPAFGLIGCLHWLTHGQPVPNHCAEAHEGFKNFRLDAGHRDPFEGGTALVDSFVVSHFGTSRPAVENGSGGRFTTADHSMEIWQLGPAAQGSWRVHVMGMGNTGIPGNICERDASIGTANRNDDVGRTLYENPSISTCADNGPYEIWQQGPMQIYVAGWDEPVAAIGFTPAVFDTATGYTRDGARANDGTDMRAFRTGLAGCQREGYHSSPRWSVYDWGIASSYTDMHGAAIPRGTFGGTLQVFELPSPGQHWIGAVGAGEVQFQANPNKGRDVLNIFKRTETSSGNNFDPFFHCYPSLAFPN